MKILPTGIAVIEGDGWASKWIEEQGRLDHDPTISQVIEPLLKVGDTAIDCGAMLGAYTHGMLRAVGKSGTVIAFEPNPVAFECLRYNCPDAVCYQMAVGKRLGTACIHPHQTNPGRAWVSDSAPGQVVLVTTVDNVVENLQLKSLNFIKIDVEGMEPEVIEGGYESIKKFRPIVFVEIRHEFLGYHGYKWHHVIDPFTKIGYTVKFIGEGHNFIPEQWPQIDVLLMP